MWAAVLKTKEMQKKQHFCECCQYRSNWLVDAIFQLKVIIYSYDNG